MLFKQKHNRAVKEALSQSDATAIYELLKTKSPQVIRLTTQYNGKDIHAVVKEVKRLEAEVNSKMSGGYVLLSASTDEEGVVTPAVYYEVKTFANMKNSLQSNLLDVETVLNDIMIWVNGDPVADKDITWFQFKKTFNQEV
jgi:hypothetical protein